MAGNFAQDFDPGQSLVILKTTMNIIEAMAPTLKNSTTGELKRGDFLYHMGEDPKGLFIIKEGLVGLFHLSENGKETFLRIFSKDSILGHRSYFSQEKYHASAIALSPTKYVHVAESDCKMMCQENPNFLREIIKILAKDLRAVEIRLSGHHDKSAQQRISETLVFLKLKYPEQTWTRKEIAEYSGSTFESVTRLMSRAEELGIIRKMGRDFEIIDTHSLLSLS